MRSIRRVGKPLEVLIVTKDPFEPWRVESILEELHPRTHLVEAASASDALTILRGRPIDFVIADYALAGPRTGLDLWQIASSVSPATRFVLLSDLRVAQYLDIVSGLTDPPECLEKPVQHQELTRVFRRFFPEHSEREGRQSHESIRQPIPALPRREFGYAAMNI